MRVSLHLEVFFKWSIMVNFACLLKLWLSCWKCLQAIIASTIFQSCRWLFSVILKLVSALPTYWLLHKMRFIKYIMQQPAELTLQNVFAYYKVTLVSPDMESSCLVLASVFARFTWFLSILLLSINFWGF